jgi:arylsulfatase A-like enzyme
MIDNNIPLNLDQIKLPSSFADSLTDKPKAQVEFRDHDQGERTKLFTEDDWKYYIAYYNYLVEYIDSQLGLITDKLRSIGQLDNTLIVFTSDHGDMLSAHRTPFKGPMMYDELVKIPVIFSWTDRIPNGEERTQLMLNTDHFPTICDLLNFPVPNMIDGVSMKEVIYQRDIPSRDSIVLQYYSKQKWVNPIRSVVQRDFKYSLYLSGEEELYHTAEDPGELHNVAESSTYAAKKSQMKQMLLQWIQDEADPFFTYTRTDRGGVPVT